MDDSLTTVRIALIRLKAAVSQTVVVSDCIYHREAPYGGLVGFQSVERGTPTHFIIIITKWGILLI